MAGRLIKSRGIYMDVKDGEYEELREVDFVGYAHYYLKECWDESELKNKADVSIYKQLLEIDTKLGTTQSEQLFECVFNTLRMDLISMIDMAQVDFDNVGKEILTIYTSCFQRCIDARSTLERPEATWKRLVTKTEKVFDFLVEEGNKRGFDVDSILEIPTSNGGTCFNIIRKELNLKAERAIESLGIQIRITGKEFDVLREKHVYVGYVN